MVIPLKWCEFRKEQKTLLLASECFAGSFPKRVEIESHHTGRKIEFFPVPEGHRFFDQDQWDGEQSVYIPTTDVANVERLVVYHQY